MFNNSSLLSHTRGWVVVRHTKLSRMHRDFQLRETAEVAEE